MVNAPDEKLPTEYPFKEAFYIYVKRIQILLIVQTASFALVSSIAWRTNLISQSTTTYIYDALIFLLLLFLPLQIQVLFRLRKGTKALSLVINSVGADIQEQIRQREEALVLARLTRDEYVESVVLNRLAMSYQLLAIYTRKEEKTSQAEVYFKKAIRLYMESARLSQLLGYESNRASSLSSIGEVYSDIGNSAKALKFYRRALSLTRQTKDKTLETMILGLEALEYAAMGEVVIAELSYEHILPMVRDLKDSIGKALAMLYVSQLLRTLGNYNYAEQLRKEAHDIYARSPNNKNLVFRYFFPIFGRVRKLSFMLSADILTTDQFKAYYTPRQS